ncbi:MAG: hypothetical protein AB1894_12395 [Chloroflexota bacterium]
MDTPFAKAKRQAMSANFKPQKLVARLTELLETRKESAREASLSSNLDHQAMRRFLDGQRPNMIACILLADHFEINPNELLELGGWPTLNAFNVKTASAENLPSEAVEVAIDVAKIADPGLRKEVAEAIKTLLKKHFSS